MTVRNLDKIFEPEKIALVGASERKGSVGRTLTQNLIDRPQGETFPINPNRDKVLETECYSTVREITETVDLAVIATPAKTVPEIVDDCGSADIPGIIIISAGFSEIGPPGKKLEKKIEKIGKEYGLRILGPNCLGIIKPSSNLNASMVDLMPNPGGITFLSQRGGLGAATLELAIAYQFGFNSFVSTGNMVDIDFGDLLDYFGRDPETESILMYIENIKNAEKFMSASRSFARSKPIMAVKSGKHKESSHLIAPRDGIKVGLDEVYDGAFKRAGITRVETMNDLFSCSETLAKEGLPRGSRLGIVTNAGGTEVMAVDALIDHRGELASFDEETIEKLDEALPADARPKNPVDIGRIATPEHYREAVEICLEDNNSDGILCIYAPMGLLDPVKTAEAIVDLKESADKPMLACWMGGERTGKGRHILRKNGFSVQYTAEESVKDFMYLNQYAKNLERLLETPEESPIDRSPPKYHIKAMIERIAKDEREILTEVESKKILRTYGIPCPEIHVVRSVDEAVKNASKTGYPVVLKVHSRDIVRKSEAGGVALNLCNQQAVRKAYEKITKNVKEACPDSEIEGVTVQKMSVNEGIELFLGCKKDPIFGSVLIFGEGGIKYDFDDVSVGFPPLNQNLAQRLMQDTKIYSQLKNEWESSDIAKKLEEYLVRLSKLIIDFPEIAELNINPFIKTGTEFLALDAQVKIDKELALGSPEPNEHLVIEPYPRKYIEEWTMNNEQTVTIRPIRPEDEPLAFEFFDTFSEETARSRFFRPIRKFTHEDMVKFTNIDYRREIGLVAVLKEGKEEKIIGMSSLSIDPEEYSGEIAVVVGDPWQRFGLGEKLVDSIIGVAKDKGVECVRGMVLENNYPMLNLLEKLGFELKESEEDIVEGIFKLS